MLMHTHTGKAAWLLGALLFACGDDGTERLSTCPDARIVTDKMGIIRCAGPKKPEDDRANSAENSAASPTGARSSSQPNRASPNDAAANGEAGESAANGGSTPAAASSAGSPAAESGAGTPAPSGGSWYCAQVMNACSCVMGPAASDTCETPKPTCCVTVKNDASVNTCVCYPEGSTECSGVKQNPSIYPPVSACPPS